MSYGNIYYTFPEYQPGNPIKFKNSEGKLIIYQTVKEDIFGKRTGNPKTEKEFDEFDCDFEELTPKQRRDRAMFLMLYFELHGSMRLRYAREIERIKSSVYLRYSQYKSQVMINKASDEQRTRLTHALSVQSIAKTIAQQLGCNWELAEAIALGHDLGHVPFGHTGEEALDECLHKAFAGRFLHALQGVKVLNSLDNHDTLFDHYGIAGQCLSKRTLEGILKHDTDCLLQDLRRASWRLQYDGWREALPKKFDVSAKDLSEKERHERRYEHDEWLEGLFLGGMESQIVYWADKIAYSGHDWEEMVTIGILDDLNHRLNTMLQHLFDVETRHRKIPGLLSREIEVDAMDESFQAELEFIYAIADNIYAIRKAIQLRHFEGKDKEPEPDSDWSPHEARLAKVMNPEDETSPLSLLAKLYEERKNWDTDDGFAIKKYKKNIDAGELEKGFHKIKGIKFRFFSKLEYEDLLCFFAVAHAFIKLTDVYPKRQQRSDDVLYCIFRYLRSINNRTIVRALERCILRQSNENIKNMRTEAEKTPDELAGAVRVKAKRMFYTRPKRKGKDKDTRTMAEIRDEVSKPGYSVSKKPKDAKANKERFKQLLQLNMIVSIPDDMRASHQAISDFIVKYYIRGPRVRIMAVKEKRIIKTLFDFFMKNEAMLPEPLQHRISYEEFRLHGRVAKRIDKNGARIETKGKENSLVYQYVWERICEQDWRDGKKELEREALYYDYEKLYDRFKEVKEKDKDKKFEFEKDELNGIEHSDIANAVSQGCDSEDYQKLCYHITQARVIADYIASMTDRMAEKKYEEIMSSNTSWSTEYSA